MIKQSVAKENISAEHCYSGADGLALLEKNDYHLIVLDVMMPGMDGFQTMEKIREQSSIPILMLTSKNDSMSKVHGLRSGADDYLTKPFDMEELIARIISLIRRYTRFNFVDNHSQPLTYKGLSIDFDSRSVTTQNGTFCYSIFLFVKKRLRDTNTKVSLGVNSLYLVGVLVFVVIPHLI